MKGLWKEKISGYNFKGDKRKKTKRKHILKDNIKYHIKANNHDRKNRLNVEDYIYTVKRKNNKELFVKLSLISYEKYKNDFFYIKNTLAFLYKGNWYDYYTKEILKGSFINELYFIENIYLDWDNCLDKYIEKRYSVYGTKVNYFLYGKPLPKDFYNMFGFYSVRRKKYIQTNANRKDRRLLKQWLSNNDFDKPIKTHALSKSIAWEVW